MLRTSLIAVLAALALARPAGAEPRHAAVDAIVAWNRIALTTTAQAPFNPPRETRSMAIVQAAVLDSVSSITHERAPYVVRVRAPRDASVAAAVASAAHACLVALYPSQQAALDARFASSRDAGEDVGDAVAAAILTLRAHDGAADPATYVPSGGIGRWVPTPPAFAPALEPGWGRVTPFVLRAGSSLRPPPPPAVGSERAARDLREIEAIGSADSSTRTPAQTEAARFWVATAPQLWNQAVQQLSSRLSPTRAAEAFAALNLAGADAFIAAWDAKFAYEQWRPVTALRAGGDLDWTPLLVTPAFPDYPAAHTTYAGAAEVVLTGLLGRTRPFGLTSASAGGVQHRYATFAAVADEVENARVWGGVHFRSSSTAGRRLGRRVGDVALRRLGDRQQRASTRALWP